MVETGRKPSNPFVGPRPFESTEADRKRFFGRDQEIAALRAMLLVKQVVVLHAPSGAGKTSLVQAGLLPALAKGRFDVLAPGRPGGGLDAGNVESLANPFHYNLVRNWRYIGKSFSGSIEEALRAQDRKLTLAGLPALRLMVLDQCEELFTWYPEHWTQRRQLMRDLRVVLDADELLRLLIVIRDDFLGPLDPLLSAFSGASQATYSMAPLRRDAAIEAVEGPLATTDVSFGDGVAEALVDDLMRVRISGNEPTEVPGEFAEPVQLQVVCDALWRNLPPGVTTISEEHWNAYGNVDEALTAFYVGAVERLSGSTGTPSSDLYAWFATQLVTEAGTRSTVFRGGTETAGLSNDVVDALDDLHLIRGAESRGGRWYELTHDRLVASVETQQRRINAAKQERTITRTRQIAVGVLVTAAALFIAAVSNRNSVAATARDALEQVVDAVGRVESNEVSLGEANARLSDAQSVFAAAEPDDAAQALEQLTEAEAAASAAETAVAESAAELAEAQKEGGAEDKGVGTVAPVDGAPVATVLQVEDGDFDEELWRVGSDGDRTWLEVNEDNRGVVTLPFTIVEGGRYELVGVVDAQGYSGRNSLYLLVDRTYVVQNVPEGDRLNIRQSPGLDADVVGTSTNGAGLSAVLSEGKPEVVSVDDADWYHVTGTDAVTDERFDGWVHATFIRWRIWDMFEKQASPPAGWTRDPVSTRCQLGDTFELHSCDPLVLTLQPGEHTVTLRGREAGTRIDNVEIVLVTSD